MMRAAIAGPIWGRSSSSAEVAEFTLIVPPDTAGVVVGVTAGCGAGGLGEDGLVADGTAGAGWGAGVVGAGFGVAVGAGVGCATGSASAVAGAALGASIDAISGESGAAGEAVRGASEIAVSGLGAIGALSTACTGAVAIMGGNVLGWRQASVPINAAAEAVMITPAPNHFAGPTNSEAVRPCGVLTIQSPVDCDPYAASGQDTTRSRIV